MPNYFKRTVLLASTAAILAMAGLSAKSARAEAEPINGYVGPGFFYMREMSSGDSSNRTYTGVTFGRLKKAFELDLFYGTGGGYKDFHLVGKYLKKIDFFASNATGLALAMGAGFNLLPNYTDANGTAIPKYWELVLHPGLKIFVDTGYGAALSFEVAMEIIPLRVVAQGAPVNSTAYKFRPMAGANLLIEFE